MKYHMTLCLLVYICCLTGCRGMYEGMNSAYVDKCYHLPYPEQQECLREVEANYDRYELERQEVLKSKQLKAGEDVHSP